MRVLIITNYLPSYSIDFYFALSKRLKKINAKLFILSDLKKKKDVNQYAKNKTSLNVFHSPIINIKFIEFRKNLIPTIRKIKPHRVVFIGNPREITVYLGLIYCKLKGIKTYMHGMFHRVGKMKLSTMIAYYLFFYLSNGCMTYGLRGQKTLSKLGLKLSKVYRVGNAINEKTVLKYKAKNTSRLKCKNNFNQFLIKYPRLKKKIVLQVVRMSKIKNPLLLIKAAHYLNQIGRVDITYVIIGKGELFESFSNEVKRLDLSNFFILLGEIYNENELSKWFCLASCFVVPSCIGLSIHKSFAYGVPVITDNSYINQSSEFELLKNNFNGLLYNKNDYKDLANKIISLVDNSSLRKKLSKNAEFTLFSNNKLSDKVENYISVITS